MAGKPHPTAKAPLDREQLHRMIADFKTAMLVTRDAHDHLHARPMMTQAREPDADVWFVSALESEKVAEMRAHPVVGVIYYRDADQSYVSLSGRAELETDRQAIQARWQESWRAWFPEGPEQANLVLIKVHAEEAEYWQPEGGQLRVIFDTARAYVTGEKPEINPPAQGRL